MDVADNVPTLEEFLISSLLAAANIKLKQQSPQQIFCVQAIPEELLALGSHLMEVSMEWKRILSPMISYELVQDALVLMFREALK